MHISIYIATVKGNLISNLMIHKGQIYLSNKVELVDKWLIIIHNTTKCPYFFTKTP